MKVARERETIFFLVIKKVLLSRNRNLVCHKKSQELFIWQVEKTKGEEGGGESFQKVYFSDIIHNTL